MTAKLFLSTWIRKSPYFEATRRYGAKELSVYNKMYLPMGYSPRLAKNIGYAMLARSWTNLGTDLMVESPNAEHTATVVAKPFVDPKKTPARASWEGVVCLI